jgi:hypothetical protein
VLRPAPQRYVRAAWWATGRRVILTSVPKCGTHLMSRLLNVIGLPARRELITEDAETGRLLREYLQAARGDALICHLHGRPTYREIARAFRTRIVFITRDPRDQAVSHLFHFLTHHDHPLHPYFRDHVPDFDDALMTVIRGFGPGPHGHLDDVATFYRYFLPWKGMDGVFHTTFERLVGPSGGGSAADQVADVHAILRHVGFPLPARLTAGTVARLVFSPTSPTFRSGQIGAWAKHFAPRHKDAFKAVAGQLLIDLGYERGLDW